MERGFFVKPTPFGEVELGDLAGAPAPLQDLPLHPGMTVEELKLTLRIREVEVRNRELEVETMLLKVKALEIERGAAVPASPASLSPSSGREDGFDVSRHIAFVPPFRESEVDSYFNAFERIAATLKWPKTVWPLLLQCKFVGKAQESLIRGDVLPFSAQSYCGSDILAWGVKMSVMRAPLHFVQLSSDFVKGTCKIAVRDQLPIAGIDLILGNDLAGGKVFPSLEVTEIPSIDVRESDPTALNSPPVFHVCAVTRAQARKVGNLVDLSDSFMSNSDPTSLSSECKNSNESVGIDLQPDDKMLCLSVDRDQLIRAQQSDPTLSHCVSQIKNVTCEEFVSYLLDDGFLMRRWFPSSGSTHDSVCQIVVPQPFRLQVLSLAHDHNMSGHLGIKKTYNRVLRYFFWPGLKSDVVKLCRSCHTCQMSGKPNQLIPAAPLRPIPVLGEPFEHVIVDCVGPLPKTKSGNQYILTIMCAATRFPEAVPLRSLKARAIVRALVKFFSTFGLPKHIQSDQGSNFMSKIFAQVMTELCIRHRKSSAYHPESQGALERFHQTLKSMIRKFCTESNREWDEGLPLLLFAVRETRQESLGFSPSDLVFGHTVRGPLRLLLEKWLSEKSSPETNILDYVSLFRERLHQACDVARESLSAAQTKMKANYDRKSVARIFYPAPCTRLPNTEILSNLKVYLANIPEPARSDIRKLIENNLVLFHDIPSQTHVISHDIDVGEHKPIKQHAYRVHPTKRTVMQQEVKYLLDHDFAVPSNSPWSSPSLLVPKPDQTSRFCNDYRKVNAITKPDSFPLPRMDDCVDRVGSAKYVTKLDLLKGHWQVPLTPRASEISAFVTPDHFLQYTVLPFGLRNAPATFQRLMNTVLSGVNTCEIYLDDIVAYSATWSEHLKTLSEIFSRLRAASLTLNLAKCEFGKVVVTYLGKQVGQGQVCPVAAKVQAILDFPAPQTRRELRRFLGMAGYYRAFCKSFSDVAAPLTSLVSPQTPYQWSEKCQFAFQAAKVLLCSALVLAAPNFTHPFKLEVDASALGADARIASPGPASVPTFKHTDPITGKSIECERCPPGSYLRSRCTSTQKTVCAPCPAGSFTAQVPAVQHVQHEPGGEDGVHRGQSLTVPLPAGVDSAMNQCEDREEGVPPSKTTLCGGHESQTKDQRMKKQRPDSAEPSWVSMKSDGSMDRPINFKDEQPAHGRVEQQSSEVHSDQFAQQHQPDLDSIFMLLEDNIVTFVKNQLKEIQRVLRPDYPEWSESQREAEEDEEQRRSSRESFVKITVNFLRRMKQEELADCLQSRFHAAVCRRKLKSDLKKKFQCVFEGIAEAGNPTLLNQIYTELYITEGGTGEVNDEHEFQVVFIFDGLDECRLPLDFHNNEILTDVTESTSVDVLLTNLIRGNLLPSARLWITTRPAAANQIPPECVDMVTEVRGFTDPQKEEYFRKRFRDEEQAIRIISHIKTSRSLHIMCHIPVFCWITATVLEDVLKTREGGELPKTLTEMYIHFLVVQSKLKNIKYDGGAETDPHWSPESRKMIESLGKLAFEQLQKGNLIFYESDLTDCGIDITAASVYSGVFTQIFIEERGLYQDKVFCFVHLSVQEFLAALHVHLTFSNSGVNLLSEQQSPSLWSKLFRPDLKRLYQTAVDKALKSPNGHLDMFLRFLLGLSLQTNQTLLRGLLTQTGSGSQTNQETVQYIKKKISKNLSELQPLASERAGPELQSSRRLKSEAAVCWTGGSTLETGHSQVRPWWTTETETWSEEVCL
ncbi:hypothetical protein Q8A73_000104 [Channa argus]|nr:hypothetical protein Q8A73_000104 [Channa argus]